MRIAAALFVAAAAFAWLTADGVLRLDGTGSTPPAIVLHQLGVPSPSSTGRRGKRAAVPRKVERAPVRAFSKQAAQP